jgi:hypothetical protein
MECDSYNVLNGEKYQAENGKSYWCVQAMQKVFAPAGDRKPSIPYMTEQKKDKGQKF